MQCAANNIQTVHMSQPQRATDEGTATNERHWKCGSQFCSNITIIGQNVLHLHQRQKLSINRLTLMFHHEEGFSNTVVFYLLYTPDTYYTMLAKCRLSRADIRWRMSHSAIVGFVVTHRWHLSRIRIIPLNLCVCSVLKFELNQNYHVQTAEIKTSPANRQLQSLHGIYIGQ